MVFTGWNLSVNHVIIPLPWIVQAPRLFTSQIKLGDIQQSVGRSERSGSVVVLPEFLRRVRRLPGVDHPALRSGHR